MLPRSAAASTGRDHRGMIHVPDLHIPASAGSHQSAYLAVPPVGDGPFPGVVVLQDAFGVREDLRDHAERLAAAGYLAGRPGPLHRARRRAPLHRGHHEGDGTGTGSGVRRHRGGPHVARRPRGLHRAASASSGSARAAAFALHLGGPPRLRGGGPELRAGCPRTPSATSRASARWWRASAAGTRCSRPPRAPRGGADQPGRGARRADLPRRQPQLPRAVARRRCAVFAGVGLHRPSPRTPGAASCGSSTRTCTRRRRDTSPSRATSSTWTGCSSTRRTPCPGADDFIRRLGEAGKQFLVLTNNSIYTPRDLQARLHASGIDIPATSLWTSALATAQFLNDQRPGGSAFVVGEAGLTTALHDVGYILTDRDPDYVVIGETRTYSFEAITRAIRLIQGGARYIVTNPDATGPSPEGTLPAAGSVAALITHATRKDPYFVGKPNPLMIRAGLNTDRRPLRDHRHDRRPDGHRHGRRHGGRAAHDPRALRRHRPRRDGPLPLPPATRWCRASPTWRWACGADRVLRGHARGLRGPAVDAAALAGERAQDLRRGEGVRRGDLRRRRAREPHGVRGAQAHPREGRRPLGAQGGEGPVGLAAPRAAARTPAASPAAGWTPTPARSTSTSVPSSSASRAARTWTKDELVDALQKENDRETRRSRGD